MMDFEFCAYFLTTKDDSSKIDFQLKTSGSAIKSQELLIRTKQPKIYVIKSENEFLYVGYASQSIITRLGQGFRANGERGYHGYKWKKLNEVELIVFVFPILTDFSTKESRTYFEAIEAELVYQIRTQTWSWPTYQNEIHFNNGSREEILEIAGRIYTKIK
jgi:hypothetical protein